MAKPDPLCADDPGDEEWLHTTLRERRLVERAEVQDRIVTDTDLAELGFRGNVVTRLVDEKRITRLRRGVYSVGPGPLSQRSRFVACLEICGDESAIAARSSAAWHAVRPDGRQRVDVITPRQCRSGRILTVHRAALPSEEITTIDGIRCTTLGRTLVDLGATHPGHLRRALVRAENLGTFDLFELNDVIKRAPTRKGVKAVKNALAEYHPLAHRTRSMAELSYLLLITKAGLPAPEVNNLHLGFELDFAWPDGRHNVEIDGPHHETAHQRALDAARDAVLRGHGWTVDRVPVADLRADPARVLRTTAETFGALDLNGIS